MRGTSLATGLAATWAAFVISSSAPAIAQDLKVLIATDERAQVVGLDMEFNRTSLERLLRSSVPQNRHVVRKVQADTFNGSSILRAIDELSVGPNDAVFFYYSGHGALDPDRNETYLLASGDDESSHVFVSQISDAIQQKQPRLAVIVLDCCNNLRPIEGNQTRFYAGEMPATEIMPAFQRLFFQGQGTVLIESSAPGEYALVEPQVTTRQPDGSYAKQSKGSLFTNFFRQTLDDRMRPPSSWEQVCRRTQVRLDERFRELCPDGLVKLGTGDRYPQRQQSIVAVVNGQRIRSRDR